VLILRLQDHPHCALLHLGGEPDCLLHGSILSRLEPRQNPGRFRLVGAMMIERNDEWALNRLYMQFEGLQALNYTALTRLLAVAR